MKWKAFTVAYFTFTRREKIGLLLLTLLIIIIFLLPDVINNIHNTNTQIVPADTAWIAATKKLEIIKTDKEKKLFSPSTGENEISYQDNRTANHSPTYGTLFYFDPNNIDEAGWKKLGLKDKTIHTIKNYLSKGGHFYKADDLKKVYGLHAGEYSRLETYIKIESRGLEETKTASYSRNEKEPKRFSYSVVDINTGDTSAFIALPGIGSKLAARIVSFRDKLGGFYSIGQLGETYGLPDSSFQKIKQYLKLEKTAVRKININSATVDELKAHPYIRYNIANPIIAYRNEHGPFNSVEDIRKVMAVTNEVYNKISAYLSIN